MDVDRFFSHYQNKEDGGFGHRVELDNWNPKSTSYGTMFSLNILEKIDYFDFEAPIFKGILYYLNQEDLFGKGSNFTIPSNDLFPHVPLFDHMEEWSNEFFLSRKWYKVIKGLEKLEFLREFGGLEND